MKTTKVWPRQPFVGLALAAVAGILAAEVYPHPTMAVWFFPLAALFAWWRRNTAGTYLCASLVFFHLHAAQRTNSPGLRLARAWNQEPQAMAVGGWVVTEPTMSARGMASFHLRLLWYERDGVRHPVDTTILARWRGEPRYGDELQLFGVAQPIDGPRNPGEFDMRAYLARRDVRHVLITRYPENGRILRRDGGNRFLVAAQASRRWMQRALARGLEDSPDVAGLINAMVLGARDDTADEVEEQFQQTGTIHLFSVSGLHVGIVAYLLWTIAHTLRVPRKGAVALIIPALFFYAAITGLNTASVRAALMAAFLLGGLFFDRRVFPANSVAAAGVVILAWDTNQLFAIGFQLSFAVVITIILAAPSLYQMFLRWGAPDPFLPLSLFNPWQRFQQTTWGALARGASVSLAAWLGSVPLILPYFYLVTPVSLFANLVVVPIAFFVLAVGLLALLTTPVAPGLAVIFNNGNWALASAILAATSLFTRAPASHVYVELPPWRNDVAAEITALDVGAGAAVHVRTPDSDWLIDCGAASDFKRIVRGYLRSRGINRLDGIILTHGDSRHLGGGPSLQRAFHPRTWIDTAASDRSSAHKTLIAHLIDAGIGRQFVAAPAELSFGNSVKARFLFPPPNFQTANTDDKTIVLQIEVAQRWRILLMSDSGLETEPALLASGVDLKSDILIKGQHHTGISGSDEFLDRVRPKLIIASSVDFPQTEHLKTQWAAGVEARGIRLLRQDGTGAVTLRFFPDRWDAIPFLKEGD